MLEIAHRVKLIIAEQLALSIDDVAPEKNIRTDLAADSLDAVELLMALEDEFGIEISDENGDKVHTVQHAIEMVVRLMPKPEAA